MPVEQIRRSDKISKMHRFTGVLDWFLFCMNVRLWEGSFVNWVVKYVVS